MPHYDYKCTQCNRQKEVFHSMFEEPKVKCDECNSKMIKEFKTAGNYIMKSGGTRK